jgi:hypothetical protein
MQMRYLVIRILVSVFVFSTCPSLLRAESGPEKLPPPREVIRKRPALKKEILDASYFRTSRYDVWKYYGVDHSGHFRPLVAPSACGYFYLADGQPFRWETVNMLEFAAMLVY